MESLTRRDFLKKGSLAGLAGAASFFAGDGCASALQSPEVREQVLRFLVGRAGETSRLTLNFRTSADLSRYWRICISIRFSRMAISVPGPVWKRPSVRGWM
jgi:hypothetical protein